MVTLSQRPLTILICLSLLVLGDLSFADDIDRSDFAAAARIVGDDIFVANIQTIRARAAKLAPEARFEFLSSVIFVDTPPGTIRLAGEFGVADPESGVGTTSTFEFTDGGELVSPVFELLDIARELGRIVELRDRVAALPPTADEFQLRARTALRLLLGLEFDDLQSAEVAADELLNLVMASAPKSLADIWPETLAVYRAVRRHQADRLASDLATTLSTSRSHNFPAAGMDVWRAHLAALTQLSANRSTEADRRQMAATDDDHQWHPVERRSSLSQGTGYPPADWQRSGHEVEHVSGHHMDFLFYRSPLRGNYEIEADLFVAGDPQMLVAGRIMGMAEGRHAIRTGTFRDGLTTQPVETHWGPHNLWSRYRAVVRDGVVTVSLDGRVVSTQALSEHHDPWVGIHSQALRYTRVRDIRITGDPVVPDVVQISADPNLPGWTAYHGDTVNVTHGIWQGTQDDEHYGQINAHPVNLLRGTFTESLLQYQRPLVEDASVSFEFYHQPGRTQADPALDRLAFLLRPEGVSLHRIADGRFETSAIDPTNSFDDRNCRRGPSPIPLQVGWNTIELSMAGSMVSLVLNNELIYERELEASNRRVFGLFRYADNELRVRNVTLRGDWPKSVPTTADQTLADPAIAQIDARLPDLRERFDHDFATDGIPPAYFRIPAGQSPPRLSPVGAIHGEQATGPAWKYSLFHPKVEMHGDFDVTLRFDNLLMPSDNSGCGLGLFLGDKHVELIRRHWGPLAERVLATYATPSSGGGNRHLGDDITTEALAGTFRIVRRGDTISSLFADRDSTAFRLVSSHTWENCGELPATLDIRVSAYNQGRVNVTWKHFAVAAERLMRQPDNERSKPVVFTINTDGSDLQQLTMPMPQFVWHASPKWSPDGKRIAYDAWSGSPGTSHVYIMDADGGNQTDLGIGFIPTFSPDGKRLAFTWAGRGLTVMNVDGTEREVVSSDGWGCEWSPDGRWLAYGSTGRTDSGAFAANLSLVDVNTREKRLLLQGELAEQFSSILWNMAWSPDSREIVFKGSGSKGSQVAIVSVDGSDKDYRVVSDENLSGNFSWHPDGSRILLSKGGKLYEYELATERMQLVAGHPQEPPNPGGAWNPSGERIVFTAAPKAESLPWNP